MSERAGGLSSERAAALLLEVGPNVLPAPAEPGLVRRVAAKFTSAFTLLLLAAAVVSIVVLREPVEGGAILAIVFLNTAIAVVQEERAAGAIRALRALTSPTARVFRSGQLQILPAAELVPGDTVRLEAGDRVPADVELVESESFAVDESNLTGESVPAEKDARRRAEDGAPLAERPGEAFASTLAVRGNAFAIVRRTGPATAVGSLASRLGERPDAPLEREVRDASWKIATFAIGLGILIALIAWRRGGEDALGDGIFAGVALAIAAVPEGLLTVVTTALALGAHRMARRGAIVRRLSAIEGLGATSVLCVDKTGTLTEGALSVAAALPVSGREKAFWEASLRCNNASEEAGDPVDLALVREARKLGYEFPAGHRAAEAPFDTATRTMATVHVVDGRGSVLSLKGAPEAVLSRCAEGDAREDLERRAGLLAEQGLRVLALAAGDTDDLHAVGLEPLGLVSFRDPLRGSAVAAVKQLQGAGISLVMVTGDHLETARAVARGAGMADSPAVTGSELAQLSAEERRARLTAARVVARVEPGVKVDLVAAHRHAGHVVAMTGDGVNDAPALRAADVGVAVSGPGGTDVAREAASIVVTNADLETLAAAVREGRLIFRNLMNAVSYLLTGNVSEIVVVLGALVLLPDLAVPLLPVQLLWINLVTDGLPAIALGLDEARGDPMSQPPRSPHERLLGFRRQFALGLRGILVGLIVLATGYVASSLDWSQEEVRTQLVFSVLAAHLMLAYVVRADAFTFEWGWWRNRFLLGAVGGSLALQFLALAIPPARSALGLEALPLLSVVLALVAAVSVVLVNDIARLVMRWGVLPGAPAPPAARET